KKKNFFLFFPPNYPFVSISLKRTYLFSPRSFHSSLIFSDLNAPLLDHNCVNNPLRRPVTERSRTMDVPPRTDVHVHGDAPPTYILHDCNVMEGRYEERRLQKKCIYKSRFAMHECYTKHGKEVESCLPSYANINNVVKIGSAVGGTPKELTEINIYPLIHTSM
uniref:Uncharacterized protein n=1 Tax=Cucumis melo TaxID=3656 RepID=A0A9I9ED26_CUCME